MDRRRFLGLSTGAGLVLAQPRILLAEPKYNHVADMYNWDKVARTLNEIRSLPSNSNQVWNIEPEKWKEAFLREEGLRSLFRNPAKMKQVLSQLTDNNVNNDEFSWVNITKFGVEYRILTPEAQFAPRQSRVPKEMENYGTIQYYLTFLKTEDDKSQHILNLIN